MAEDWPGAGIYTASDPTDFVNADDASLPFAMGEGRLDWTGGDATVARDLSFWAPQYRANAFKVSDANATLTLAGKFTQTNGCFIKTGPGTLALTYPGWQQLGKGPQNASLLGRTVMWDETTGACTNGGFAHVTVDEGTLVLGAPGATNNITSMTFIGNRTQKYAALDITNGVVVQPNNWFCIARGTGQTSNDARAEVFVRKGARLEVNQLNIGYANGMGSAFPRASLTVDGGTVSVPYQIYTLETGNGEAHVVITNGASFVNNYWNAAEAGWRMKNASGGTAYVDISASSTGSAYYVSLHKNGFLNVRGQSRLEFDRTMPDGVNNGRGQVAFDDSTLGSRMAGIDPLWFYGYGTNSFFVGPRGMTFDVQEGNDAALYPPVCVKGSTARANAPLKKTGPGSLALVLPYQHPLVVEDGNLRLRNLSHNWEQMPSQTPTLAAGSKLVAAGEGAFGRLTIPVGTPLVLRAQGMETSQHGNWYCTGWAAVRPDGFLTLKYDAAHYPGSLNAAENVPGSEGYAKAEEDLTRFLRKLRTAYRKLTGQSLRAYWETANWSPRRQAPARLHQHLVVPSDAVELARRLWPAFGGEGTVIVKDLDSDPDRTRLAEYMVGNVHGKLPGSKGWSGSRGLDKPVLSEPEEIGSVDEIQPPPGAVIKEVREVTDEDGIVVGKYLRYVLPKPPKIRGGQIVLPRAAKRGGKRL